MNTMNCPFCEGPVHKKNKVKIARLGGQLVQRYYCPSTCKKYHLRDLDTGDVLALEGLPLNRPPVPAKPVHVALAEGYGIDADALEPKAFDKGKPRFNINGFSPEDLDQLEAKSPIDAIDAQLATKLILVGQAVIAAIKAKK